MAYYGYIPRDMSTIIAGEVYAIAERRPGWGQWDNSRTKAVAVRELPNTEPVAWQFRLEDNTRVQRSAEGVHGTWAHCEKVDAERAVETAAREAATAVLKDQVEPWVDRLQASERWRALLQVSCNWLEVNKSADEQGITITTNLVGLRRLCYALLGDEAPTMEKQT